VHVAEIQRELQEITGLVVHGQAEEVIMKLVIAVVHDRDRTKLTDALLREGFQFTRLGSSGGFLKEGNVTLFIGCADADVNRVFGLLRECTRKRKQYISVLPPDAGPAGTILPSPVEVEVGGAVAFVMPIERFETF
jgi:uncharacterized protein YaaQ